MSTGNTNMAQVIGSVVAARVLAVAGWLGSFGARFLTILFFTVLLGYWLFVTVWQPLGSIRPLPAEVTEINPAVDIKVLEQISSQRLRRLEYKSIPLAISGVITDTVALE